MINPICEDIIRHLKINKFIETGTFEGGGLAKVESWFDKNHDIKFYSVEANAEYQKKARARFESNPRVNLFVDSSEKFLKESIDAGLFNKGKSCLFFLDAHWQKHCPLRDEIQQILRLEKSVIVIDDFAIPFNFKATFDAYNSKALSWFYIKDLFKNTHADIYYPKILSTDNCGTIIIYVGYESAELEFMKKLPCYKPWIKGEPFALFFPTHRNSLIKILKFFGLYECCRKLKHLAQNNVKH